MDVEAGSSSDTGTGSDACTARSGTTTGPANEWLTGSDVMLALGTSQIGRAHV